MISLKVVISGPAAIAGSTPTFLKINGMLAPRIEAFIITASMESARTKPNVGVSKTAMMPNSRSPQTAPLKSETLISLLSLLKVSSGLSSPKAIPLTTIVAAWIPELPPMAIIIGMKNIAKKMSLKEASNWESTNAAINWPTNPTSSQGKRPKEILNTEVSRISSSSAIPAIFWISSEASSSMTSTISSTVIRPTNFPSSSTTGSETRL